MENQDDGSFLVKLKSPIGTDKEATEKIRKLKSPIPIIILKSLTGTNKEVMKSKEVIKAIFEYKYQAELKSIEAIDRQDLE
ncbi:MAG: hypothetical protein WBA13_05110 [Microcoleaceae cyanobacterium]